MQKGEIKKESILVVGEDKLAFSITVCLLHAGHPVTLFSEEKEDALESINMHFSDMSKQKFNVLMWDHFNIIDHLGTEGKFSLAIVITKEDLSYKRSVIKQLENFLPSQALIAINTESFPLSALHQDTTHPERIIGANWVEPAHTTYFLEVISNESNYKELVSSFYSTAKLFWQKDPYLLNKGNGIRTKMMSALVREAFYLIEKGYVSVEDIDRACRNDPGYYLPFVGNCRYMDLIHTNGYGLVMQDLNPELSKERHIPAFFMEVIQQGARGMKNCKGLYTYQKKEVERRENLFRKFSYQIQQIIAKYSFCDEAGIKDNLKQKK